MAARLIGVQLEPELPFLTFWFCYGSFKPQKASLLAPNWQISSTVPKRSVEAGFVWSGLKQPNISHAWLRLLRKYRCLQFAKYRCLKVRVRFLSFQFHVLPVHIFGSGNIVPALFAPRTFQNFVSVSSPYRLLIVCNNTILCYLKLTEIYHNKRSDSHFIAVSVYVKESNNPISMCGEFYNRS